MVICPISFVSEHIETLLELDHEYAELAGKLGCPAYVRVPALGVDGVFVAALAQAVISSLDRASGAQPGSTWRCDAAFGHCPARHNGGQAA